MGLKDKRLLIKIFNGMQKKEQEKKEKSKEIYVEAVGRRKTASARVKIEKGTGTMVVNGQAMHDYFPTFSFQTTVLAPLKALALEKEINVSAKVEGGGKAGQATAVQHGIARALVVFNEEFRKILKTLGFLTRDPRGKERKKFGLKRARKAPQWSKR